MGLRKYQSTAIAEAMAELSDGASRVLVVAPTGAGKGTMAAAALAEHAGKGGRAVFLVHRREIALDITRRLRKSGVTCGTILPGQKREARALVQIATVQSLIDADAVPSATLVIVDEAHHYAADEWGAVLLRYPKAAFIGFTATPQRADGRAMGDVFERLIIAATYAQMLASGYLVPCEVLRPLTNLGIDLAQDPLTAYRRYAGGQPALIYVRRVAEAIELLGRFKNAKIAAGVVHGKTGKAERDDTMRKLADGSLTVVINVYALTEGVDIPRVGCIVLARTCAHASTYVQIVGRALRAHAGKRSALLLDLTGCSHKHGLPTDDRVYSLQGSGMGEAQGERDGAERVERVPKVIGVALCAAGSSMPAPTNTAPDPKRVRWDALAAKVEAGELTIASAVERYASAEGEKTAWVSQLSEHAKQRERDRLVAMHPRLGLIRFQELLA
jgi:DNA repair protein RadD